MKSASNIVLSAAVATSAMTLFSYVVSGRKDENFREPELLGTFLKRSLGTGEKTSRPLGWAAHYLVGIGFAAGYKLLLHSSNAQPSAKSGLFYGGLAGATGVLTWDVLFKKHPNPPKTHKRGFYAQLIIAHLIFGLTLAACQNKRTP